MFSVRITAIQYFLSLDNAKKGVNLSTNYLIGLATRQ